ncbi:MAG: right-handed parallel beta-helix repeat-containing protein [Bacteroidota bacterium]
MRLTDFLQLFSLFLLIGLTSCSKDNTIDDDDIIYMEGLVRIDDTLVIEEGKELRILPGTEVTFAPAAIFVAHGNLIIEGTSDNPIKLIAEDPIEDHRIITAKSGCEIFTMKHVEVQDGLITSFMSKNHFRYVTFRNDQKLRWNDAVARFWFGSVLIEDCVVEWNNEGEGFLLHSVPAPIVRNNRFIKVPDAVEYIHCKYGSIIGNYFEGNGDDAIDQNHCFKTMIRDNQFYYVKDRALELGSENMGSSDSLFVINNLFVGCKVALNIKESSFAIVENATFYRNKISIDIHTSPDSSRISKAEIYKSVVIESEQLPASLSPGSEAVLQDCVSDEALPDGVNNIISNIEFRDPENDDFTIIGGELPTGLTVETIGYQAPE